MHSSISTLQSNASRQAINAPIQGTGSDLTMLSVIAINKWLNETGKKSLMIATVHDSIVFDVYIPELADLAQEVKTIMENVHKPYIDTVIPILSDLELGANYGTTFDVSLDECLSIHNPDDFRKWNHDKCIAKYTKEIKTLHDKGWDYKQVLKYCKDHNRPVKELLQVIIDTYSDD